VTFKSWKQPVWVTVRKAMKTILIIFIGYKCVNASSKSESETNHRGITTLFL